MIIVPELSEKYTAISTLRQAGLMRRLPLSRWRTLSSWLPQRHLDYRHVHRYVDLHGHHSPLGFTHCDTLSADQRQNCGLTQEYSNMVNYHRQATSDGTDSGALQVWFQITLYFLPAAFLCQALLLLMLSSACF